MSIATLENETVAVPVDQRRRYREMLISAAEGEPLDPAELLSTLVELGLDVADHRILLGTVRERRRIVASNEQHVKDLARLTARREDREQVELEWQRRKEELLAKHREELAKLGGMLSEFDAQHGAEIECLNANCISHSNDRSSGLRYMETTADAGISHEINRLSTVLADLEGQAAEVFSKLAPKTIHPPIVASGGGGPLKGGGGPHYADGQKSYVQDRAYWQKIVDGSEATLADKSAGDETRARARRELSAAKASIESIDETKRNLAEISRKIKETQQRLTLLREAMGDWRCFSLRVSK